VYPGLASHPQHRLLRSMLNPGYGFGGMLAVDLGTSARAYDFMNHLQNDANFGYMVSGRAPHWRYQYSTGKYACPPSPGIPRSTRGHAPVPLALHPLQ